VTLERTWLLGTARAEREALGRKIQYTEPASWNEPSILAGWRNRDILAHLAAAEVAAAAIMGGERPAEFEEFEKTLGGERFAMAAFNEWTVARRHDEPFRSVVTEWGRAADLFLARSSTVPLEDWSVVDGSGVGAGCGALNE